ncbi:hypothetical protein L1987_20631 [Smallanthus sonchifolius]|uniref:Uncharacterized protein n=1 Tax=Smallanthus sonchifolius TaxID=185202 RepID=A0ACB9IU25_9ASTR|nr:hypothetical protein L1987_20631 [Smallanthus sonchifolius]
MEPPPLSSKRPANSESEYELEEPRAKKIKTWLESLTSSTESLFEAPEHPTPIPSPIYDTITPQPTFQQTPPVSPAKETSPSFPRVKKLSLEVMKLNEQMVQKDEEIKLLKSNLADQTEEVKDLKLEGETNVSQSIATGGLSSPAFVTNPESALTIYSDEEEIGSDHELDELLKQIDDFGTIEEFPEIVTLGEEHGEKIRYFTEEGDEIEALSDSPTVKVTFVEPETTDGPIGTTEEASQTEPTPTEPTQDTRPNLEYPNLKSSLPRYDLRASTKLPLQNPGKVNEAHNFELFLQQQAQNNFRSMKTILPKRIISKTKIHPRTQKPWQLKFPPEDLEVLFNNPTKIFHEDDEADAKAYQRVVTVNAKPHFQKSSDDPTA